MTEPRSTNTVSRYIGSIVACLTLASCGTGSEESRSNTSLTPASQNVATSTIAPEATTPTSDYADQTAPSEETTTTVSAELAFSDEDTTLVTPPNQPQNTNQSRPETLDKTAVLFVERMMSGDSTIEDLVSLHRYGPDPTAEPGAFVVVDNWGLADLRQTIESVREIGAPSGTVTLESPCDLVGDITLACQVDYVTQMSGTPCRFKFDITVFTDPDTQQHYVTDIYALNNQELNSAACTPE